MTSLLTIPEVAAICRVTERTVRGWIDTKQLGALRIGPKLIRIDELELYRFLG